MQAGLLKEVDPQPPAQDNDGRRVRKGQRWSESFVTKNQRLAPYTHTTLGANSTGIERRSALAEATVLIGTRAFQISHALSRDDKEGDGEEERPLM